MSILVHCECGRQFKTRDEHAGRRAKCPNCGQLLTVPGYALSPLPGDVAERSITPAAEGTYDTFKKCPFCA